MQRHQDPVLLVSRVAGAAVELQPFSRQLVDMCGPDALRETFRLACLTSSYFGGNLVVVHNWLPALTLRVAMEAGGWLADLQNIESVIRALDDVGASFDACWNETEYDFRSWLDNPRRPAVHRVRSLGNTTICWTDRVMRVERPILELDAEWVRLPGQGHWSQSRP